MLLALNYYINFYMNEEHDIDIEAMTGIEFHFDLIEDTEIFSMWPFLIQTQK